MGFNVHFSRHGGNKKFLFLPRLKDMLFRENYLNSEPYTEGFGRVCSLLSTSCHCADKHNFKSIQTVLCNTLLLLCNKIEKHSTVASAVVGNVFKPAFTLAYLVDKLLSSYLSLPPTFHHVYLCNNAYRGPQVVKKYGFIKSQILDCRLQSINF